MFDQSLILTTNTPAYSCYPFDTASQPLMVAFTHIFLPGGNGWVVLNYDASAFPKTPFFR